jgi:hypothetical protein
MESWPLSDIRDCGHDGLLCTFTLKQQLETPSACSWTAPVSATGTVRQGRRYGPSITVQIRPAGGHCPPAKLRMALCIGPALYGNASSLSVPKKGVGSSTTLAWPGWKQPYIAVKVDRHDSKQSG